MATTAIVIDPSTGERASGGQPQIDPATGERAAPKADYSSLTANPKGEGTYSVKSPDGQTLKVPYSNVPVFTRNLQGFSFSSPDEHQRFEKDVAADPHRPTFWNVLTNPVGSGAASGLGGYIEQAGGRFINGVANTPGAIAKAIASIPDPDIPIRQETPDDPISQRATEFQQEWKQDPGLAVANAVGDAGAMAEGGRLGDAAMNGVEPSPSLGPLNRILPSAVQRGVIPSAAQALQAAAGPVADIAKSAAGKLVPALIDGPPESLMTRAIKPGKNNVSWNSDVQTALPLMKSAEQQLGRPIASVDDALDAANIAKKGVWQQYQTRLQASGQMGATIDGNQIADAMMNNIDKRTAVQNPGLVQKVQQIADTYRRPLSVSDAEDFLQSANKDLNSYYAKNKVGQQVAQNDPEISSTVAEAGALRDALYGKLDQIGGPGAAQLKQAYGSLTNVQKELYGRQLVAARQNPESLSEQLSTVSGAGKIIKGVATLNPGDVLEGTQNIAVSGALKARNSSDSMIERAFAKAQPAQPFPMPSSPRFAGFLDRGAIPMGAPESASNPASAPPPVDATTRAQRLGLLLPNKTGGPIELPYVPEMSGGERVAALMQYLRQHPQAALPARASAIPLPPGN